MTRTAARAARLPLTNDEVARRLEAAARQLEEQDANVYRVRAYRTAANTVRGLDRPLSEIVKKDGRDALDELPGIGDRPHLHALTQPVSDLQPRGGGYKFFSKLVEHFFNDYGAARACARLTRKTECSLNSA